MRKFKYYLDSFRLRTLPLSVSGIIIGAALAYTAGYCDMLVFLLALLTTLFLQILSNISNEYGDNMQGVDNEQSLGPVRSLQAGHLSFNDYKMMISLFGTLSVISGTFLVAASFESIFRPQAILMLFIGGVAIIAAIKYTVGRNNYGYQGWGDVAVFIFFGWVSTLGSYYLLTYTFEWSILLPATAMGLLITAVLNINNLRDRSNDKAHGKNTLVVKIGERNARIYHTFLIIGGWVSLICYTLFHHTNLWNWLYLLLLPLFFYHLYKVFHSSGKALDSQLRNLSLSILLLAILFSASVIIVN